MELVNGYWEIKIVPQAGEPEPQWNDPLLQSSAHHPEPGLLDVLRGLKEGCDIVMLKVIRISGVRFDYTFKHSDARAWHQEIRLGTDVLSTEVNFDVPDFWTEAELRGAPDLRGRASLIESIIELLLAYPTEKIRVDWL